MKNRLGRGLDSLIGGDAPVPGGMLKIGCDTIDPNPYQPRQAMDTWSTTFETQRNCSRPHFLQV